jgi:sugar/nucleoside kinase (ribokinase family)
MSGVDRLQRQIRRPIIAGSGLIALDLVLNHENQPIYMRAGGTCGNVLTILSYLGWSSFPIARLASEEASALISQDLGKWGVHLDFVSLEPRTPSPIVIQRIRQDTIGIPRHSYSGNCPLCGTSLPRYRPVPSTAAVRLSGKLTQTAIFFFDRVSRGVLLLAQEFAKQGALVVFEPSAVGDPDLFGHALSIADVVKYADEKRTTLDMQWTAERPLLEIETLGTNGLRYRSRLQACHTQGWVYAEPCRVSDVRDTSGAGDWCTAGILSILGTSGKVGFMSLSLHKIEQAMSYAQALAAWSCRFEGARGGMYKVSKRQFKREVGGILGKGSPEFACDRTLPGIGWRQWQRVCPNCRDSEQLTSRSEIVSTTTDGLTVGHELFTRLGAALHSADFPMP